MEATIRSVWMWAVTQFNNTIGGIKSLWYKLLDILSDVKDAICSLLSSLKARFCYSSETASFTTSTSMPSSPGGEVTEKVKVTYCNFEMVLSPYESKNGKIKIL